MISSLSVSVVCPTGALLCSCSIQLAYHDESFPPIYVVLHYQKQSHPLSLSVSLSFSLYPALFLCRLVDTYISDDSTRQASMFRHYKKKTALTLYPILTLYMNDTIHLSQFMSHSYILLLDLLPPLQKQTVLTSFCNIDI